MRDNRLIGKTASVGETSGPKYKRIYSQLREMIAFGGPYQEGARLPSENEMVDRFAASRPTIGRALAQLESEGLVERRAGSGTFVSRRTEHIGDVFGLLIPQLGITEIFEPICQGISKARLGGHHDLLWGPLFDASASKEAEAERLCEYFVKRRVSGVFFAPLELAPGKDAANQRIVDTLDAAGIPVVLLDRDIYEYPRRSRFDLVGIDNHRAGYVIAEHLIALGCKRIVFFARPESAPTVVARCMGYGAALRAQCGQQLEEMAEFGDAGDPEAIREMLARCRPDAIMCANDITAARLMTTLYALGVQIPSEIKVAGIDDLKYSGLLQVPLTTIHQPCMEIGATALMAMLDRVLHPETPARSFYLDFRLCMRQSTQGAAPAVQNA